MLGPLHDRTREMTALLDAFAAGAAGRPQLMVVSGHRRVGKTYLLLHAIDRLEDQRAVFFSATQQSQAVELERFSRALQPVFTDEPLLADATLLGTWERALTTLVQLARRTAITLVVDEAPYLEASTPGFASIVQAVWDRMAAQAGPTHLSIVLTGSAPTVMEQMVGPDGPLRGRVTSHLRLKPFDLRTAAEILDLQPAAAIEAYAACGGWPLHLMAWDGDATTAENLRALAGEPGGILLDDADHILRELPDGPGFGRVLAAVGRGRRTFGDIASDAGQRIEYPLEFLCESGLVARETPVGAPRRARPQYEISDAYLRFWFNVLYSDRAQIEGGMGHAVLKSREGEWARHLGWVFEEQARLHARQLVAKGVVDPMTIIGRWWSTGRQPVEVDVLGLSEGHTVLLGEAKWASRFDPRWLQRLHDGLHRVPTPTEQPQRWLWTRAAPPDGLPDDVTVFGPSDMIA